MKTHPTPEIKHPYVAIDPAVKGANPVITGTRTKVVDIAIRYELGGMTPDQIIDQFPHLTLAQVHDALSYYYEHKAEIDKQHKADKLVLDELRRIYPSKFRKACHKQAERAHMITPDMRPFSTLRVTRKNVILSPGATERRISYLLCRMTKHGTD